MRIKNVPAMCLFGVAIHVLAACSEQYVRGAQQEEDKSPVEIFDAATGVVHSFEIQMVVTRRYLVIEEGAGVRRLNTGEQGRIAIDRYKQIFSRGKRRIEQLDPVAGNVTWIVVSDGTNEDRSLRPSRAGRAAQGSIERPLPDYVADGGDYLGFFRCYGSVDLPSHVFTRKNATCRRDQDRAGFILEAGPVDIGIVEGSVGAPALPNWGFRVFLDSLHGLMPRKIEKYRVVANGEGNNLVSRRISINEFHLTHDGVWVPVNVTCTAFMSGGALIGEPNLETTAVVDIEKSRWNTDVPDGVFTLDFPPGTEVHDNIRNVEFVAGSAKPDEHLRELAYDAKNIVVHPPAMREPTEAVLPSDARLSRRFYIGVSIISVTIAIAAWVAFALIRKSQPRHD